MTPMTGQNIVCFAKDWEENPTSNNHVMRHLAAAGNRVLVTFLDAAPPHDAFAHARHVDGEECALGAREIYVRYTDTGMGKSKLIIPAALPGTARNMNTVCKMAELLA